MNFTNVSCIVGLMVGCALPVTAQSIPVKTYPLLCGEGFTPELSSNVGLGGVSIAHADSLSEPFENPASLMTVGHNVVAIAPGWRSWSLGSTEILSWRTSTTEERSRASTLPVSLAVVQRADGFAVGVEAGFQRVASGYYWNQRWGTPKPTTMTIDHSFGANNWSERLSVAVPVPGADMSIGAGVGYTDIRGVDGIQFLYPDVRELTVAGSNIDARLGVAGRFAQTDVYTFAVGYNAFDVKQHAVFDQRPTVDNQDITRTWFAQARYRLRLSEKMNVGLMATGNRKEHPKIAEYPIASVPRDPGVTWAFNLGAGASWYLSPDAAFTVEGIVEPIDSKTWVAAAQDWVLADSSVLRKGEPEQHNDYSFLNYIVRFGMSIQAESWLALKFGAETRFYSFDYHHKNNISGRYEYVAPQSSWTEVQVSGGAEVRAGDWTFEYVARVLSGEGLLKRTFGGIVFDADDVRTANDYLMPPNRNVSMTPVMVVSHRLMARLAIDVL